MSCLDTSHKVTFTVHHCLLVKAPIRMADNTYYILMYFWIVSVAAIISPEVMDQTQNKGDTASFTCQATGRPVPTISWYYNGAQLVDGSEYMITEMLLNTTTISNILTIMSVELSDVGTYTCNATNVMSSDTSSGVLTVNGELLLLTVYFINDMIIVALTITTPLEKNFDGEGILSILFVFLTV